MLRKSLLLTSLAITPYLSAIPTQTQNVNYITSDNETQEENESCTFMYVGKDVSTTGLAFVARSADSTPRTMNINGQVFEHNQLANQIVKGKNGFEYQMPSTTYKYISTPRNPSVKGGLHWEASAINEKGVAVSATLSCYTNSIALDPVNGDPFVSTGITEDNIAQIIGATATSAKQGIEIIASIIDKQGNGEDNAIMVMDKNETWYMEMYTGHQYVAVKMPDDRCCTIGNEFMLNTLKDFKPYEVITSPDYYNLPHDKGFAKYDGSGTAKENLHLYNTYAGYGTNQGAFNDSSHMRTWRGLSLFTDHAPLYGNVAGTDKYEPFFKPNRKLSLDDVITFMRDRFDDILTDETNPNHEYFLKVYQEGKLRWVGDNTAYQVHVLTADPTLPYETSITEWLALSCSNYTPFVPINNGVNSLSDYYSHFTELYGYDDQAACCIFKRLNSLADTDRLYYGLPIQEYMSHHEDIWQKQYKDLLAQIQDLSMPEQQNILTNYCCEIQDVAIALSKNTFDDLFWHINNLPPVPTEEQKLFTPLINLEYYGYCWGWNYSFNNNVVSLQNDTETIAVDFDYSKISQGWIIGKVIKNGVTVQEDVRLKYDGKSTYMDYAVAKNYMSKGYDVATINYKDYDTYTTKPSWILPVAIAVPVGVVLIAAGVVTGVLVSKKKKTKAKTKTK